MRNAFIIGYLILILMVYMANSIANANKTSPKNVSKVEVLLANGELLPNDQESTSEQKEIEDERIISPDDEDTDQMSVIEKDTDEEDSASLVEENSNENTQVDTVEVKQAAPERKKKWWQFWK